MILKNKISKIRGQFFIQIPITDKHKISNMFNLFSSKVDINLAKQ